MDSIRSEYARQSAGNAGRGIDDFETFVRARVAEHFINTSRASTMTIYAQIDRALSGPPGDLTAVREDRACGDLCPDKTMPQWAAPPQPEKPKTAPFLAFAAGALLLALAALALVPGKEARHADDRNPE